MFHCYVGQAVKMLRSERVWSFRGEKILAQKGQKWNISEQFEETMFHCYVDQVVKMLRSVRAIFCMHISLIIEREWWFWIQPPVTISIKNGFHFWIQNSFRQINLSFHYTDRLFIDLKIFQTFFMGYVVTNAHRKWKPTLQHLARQSSNVNKPLGC